ncbi:unnamed protein product, partial [Gulo gulo]
MYSRRSLCILGHLCLFQGVSVYSRASLCYRYLCILGMYNVGYLCIMGYLCVTMCLYYTVSL